MSDQQGGAPGQPESNAAHDQEGTQVGMPVPPATPGYSQQQPPQSYGQLPYGAPGGAPMGYAGQAPPPPPPGYGGQPPGYGGQPTGYGAPPGGYPPAGYPYQAPPPKRGVSPLLLGLFALLLVLALGVGGMYAFGLGPFAPSATPTAAAQATPTPSKPPATATPADATPSPTPTATPPETTAPATTAPATTAPVTLPPITLPPISLPPTTSPGADEAALLLHVPEEFRDTCNTSLVLDGLASVTCTSGDITANNAIFVKYSQYADFESMQAAYDLDVSAFGPDAGDEDCAVAGNWPSEYPYTIDEVHAGRVMCVDFVNQPHMYWTDERVNILSWSFPGGEVTKEEMHSFWTSDAGPNEVP